MQPDKPKKRVQIGQIGRFSQTRRKFSLTTSAKQQTIAASLMEPARPCEGAKFNYDIKTRKSPRTVSPKAPNKNLFWQGGIWDKQSVNLSIMSRKHAHVCMHECRVPKF